MVTPRNVSCEAFLFGVAFKSRAHVARPASQVWMTLVDVVVFSGVEVAEEAPRLVKY